MDLNTTHLNELYGQKRMISGYQRAAQYPEDLENLIAFITRQADSSTN